MGIAADVVFGPGRQHERKPEPAHPLRGGRDPLGGVAQLVDPAGWIVVLDRSADCPGRGDPRDREGGAVRVLAVAVLEVDRERQVSRLVDSGRVRDHLVQHHAAVETTEGEGEPGTRGRERLEPKRLEHPCGARVPWIGQHERPTGVQRLEIRRLLPLLLHGCLVLLVALDHIAPFHSAASCSILPWIWASSSISSLPVERGDTMQANYYPAP